MSWKYDYNDIVKDLVNKNKFYIIIHRCKSKERGVNFYTVEDVSRGDFIDIDAWHMHKKDEFQLFSKENKKLEKSIRLLYGQTKV